MSMGRLYGLPGALCWFTGRVSEASFHVYKVHVIFVLLSNISVNTDNIQLHFLVQL